MRSQRGNFRSVTMLGSPGLVSCGSTIIEVCSPFDDRPQGLNTSADNRLVTLGGHNFWITRSGSMLE